MNDIAGSPVLEPLAVASTKNPLGEYKVVISPPIIDVPVGPPKDGLPPPAVDVSQMPERYRNPETTPFTLKVERKGVVFDMNMTP